MKRYLLLPLAVCSIKTFCSEWNTLIERYKDLMGEQTYVLINKQYQAFSTGISPKISHLDIKAIPIVEEDEPLVNINGGKEKRICSLEGDLLVQAHTYPHDVDPRSKRYAYVRAGVYQALSRMIKELDRLAPSFGYQAGDLHIMLFEGTRDLATQKELFDTKCSHIMRENPQLSYEQAYEETCCWVSPYINNTPVHSTGAAVDIALYDAYTKQFCSMGRFNTSGLGAPLFSEDPHLTAEQKKHRMLFLIAATRAGLVNYSYEYWHYSYNDRYSLYWNSDSAQENLHSPYGGISY